MSDTIFAEATAPGRAGVSVVRISGPGVCDVLSALVGGVPEERRAELRRICRRSGELLDEGLVLFFAEGRSFTGDDVAELHLHGSRAVVAAVLDELGRIDGLRMAEPGEFTRRALENGRLDLAQVEGLADLIDAETDLQRQQAIRVFRGGLSELAERWREGLVRARALLEVTIDFSDEDVPDDVSAEVMELLGSVRKELLQELRASTFAEQVRSGFEVAIVGPPNAGKSTLLNYLAGRDAAITSPIAGTTRDVIEVRMDLEGIPVTLIDTAGIRETDDPLEAEGVSRARSRAANADLRVVLGEGFEVGEMDLLVVPKSDLGVAGSGLRVSSVTGEGMHQLVEEIAARLQQRLSISGSAIRLRHRQALLRISDALEAALNHLEADELGELTVEEIRFATDDLSRLVGQVGVEDILDVVFSGFCIGK